MAVTKRLVKGSALTHSEMDGNLTHLAAQSGVYDAAFTYAQNAITSYAGFIYKSLQNTNLNKTPSTEPTWWSLLGIDYTQLTNIPTQTLLGRSTAGTGAVEQLTLGAGLSLAGGILSASGAVYTDEQAQDAIGSILADSAEIDWTYNDGVPSIGASLITGSVALSKIANISTSRLLGRSTAGSGVIEQLTIGTGLSLTAGVLAATSVAPDFYAESSGTPAVTPIATGTGNVTLGDGNEIDAADYSSIGGGRTNLIEDGAGNSAYDSIVGGLTNTITNSDNGFIGAGESNTLTTNADHSAILGGHSNTITTATHSVILGGLSNGITSGAHYSAAIGRSNTGGALYGLASGYQARTYLLGQFARASGFFTEAGDAQVSLVVVRNNTTNNTTTTLFLDGASLQIATRTGASYRFTVNCVGRQHAGSSGTVGDTAGFLATGTLKNVSGTLSIIGTPAASSDTEAATAAWTMALSASGANFQVRVTGETNKSVKWVASVRLEEVLHT